MRILTHSQYLHLSDEMKYMLEKLDGLESKLDQLLEKRKGELYD
jgi:hypothetical protein